jgi:hypothetical protein
VSRGVLTFSTTVNLNEPASVTIGVVGPHGHALQLGKGSSAGGIVLSANRSEIAISAPVGLLHISLHIRAAALEEGARYRVLIRTRTSTSRTHLVTLSLH